MMHQVLRWTAAIAMQIVLTVALGLLLPFQLYAWTTWPTLWMLPIGLVLGAWLGAWPIWPQSSNQRWLCLASSGCCTVLLILLMLVGVFGQRPPYLWIPLFPILGFDVAAAWLQHRSHRAG
jgi:hypothetical protein